MGNAPYLFYCFSTSFVKFYFRIGILVWWFSRGTVELDSLWTGCAKQGNAMSSYLKNSQHRTNTTTGKSWFSVPVRMQGWGVASFLWFGQCPCFLTVVLFSWLSLSGPADVEGLWNALLSTESKTSLDPRGCCFHFLKVPGKTGGGRARVPPLVARFLWVMKQGDTHECIQVV